MYRCALTHLTGRVITAVGHTDALVVPDSVHLTASLLGASVSAIRRHGKVVLIETERMTVGVHFGMTGRMVVGDHEPIVRLAYGPTADDQRFDRWVFDAQDPDEHSALRVRLSDPRRLARVVMNPTLTHLGPDVMGIDAHTFTALLGHRRAPIKTVLTDQRVVAGLGNLLADELLWRAGVAPQRRVLDLTCDERNRLGTLLPIMLSELFDRGGSHTGDLAVPLRRKGTHCPNDGVELVRRTIGGRTSWSCPLHQR